MQARLKRLLCGVLIALGLTWIALATFDFLRSENPGYTHQDFAGRQPHLFLISGRDSFGDFFIVRKWSDLANPFRPQAKGDAYICGSNYLPLPLLILKAFPNTRGGAIAFSVCSAITLLFAWVLLIKTRIKRDWALLCGTLLLNWLWLFAFERGNFILLTIAGVVVFLAWYDAEERWKRIVAAAAISLATVLKISPVFFGLLYLKKRQWKEIAICVVVSLLLTLVPFLFYGGYDAFVWLYRNLTSIGGDLGSWSVWDGLLVERVVRSFSLAPLQPAPDDLNRLVQIPFKVIGWLFLLAAALWSFGVRCLSSLRKQEVVALIAGAVMLVTGFMMEYGALYLIPWFISWMEEDEAPTGWIPLIGWLLLFMPLQFLDARYDWNCRNNLIHFVGFLLLLTYLIRVMLRTLLGQGKVANG